MKKCQLQLSILWNDPWEQEGIGPSPRGIGIHLLERDVLEAFLENNRLKMMIRAHSALSSGYEWYFNNKLLSLFLTSLYYYGGNLGAFTLINISDVSIYAFEERDGKYAHIK